VLSTGDGRDDEPYRLTASGDLDAPECVRRFRLTIADGTTPATTLESAGDRCSIGAHPSNDLVLRDATVSRLHCEVRITENGPMLVDLGSRNGTSVDGVRIREAFLREGCRISGTHSPATFGTSGAESPRRGSAAAAPAARGSSPTACASRAGVAGESHAATAPTLPMRRGAQGTLAPVSTA
jgi:hypothetical protein